MKLFQIILRILNRFQDIIVAFLKLNNRGFIMSIEQTLSIVKPDAVAKNVIGKIITRFEDAGLKVFAAKMKQLKREEAEAFYAVHKERPFFIPLVNFMIQGPVLILVLKGENAILKNRDIMGATNPKKPAPGQIRPVFPIQFVL